MKNNLKNLTITAMLFALGMVLPFFTGQIPQIGGMLLPMHLPVFLCALICGWQYGLPMAFLLPLLRSMPVSYTHLDVYKRQGHWCRSQSSGG